jgi:prevent-host-death family protein
MTVVRYYSVMPMSASDLRRNVYRVLDRVVETGQPVEIERRGRRLRIVPAEPASKMGRLIARPGYLRVDANELVHLDWSREWRP